MPAAGAPSIASIRSLVRTPPRAEKREWILSGVVTRVDAAAQTASVSFSPDLHGELAAADAAWARTPQKQKLEAIPGTVPTLRGDIKPGCRFAPRCALAKPMHFENTPPLKEVRPGHKVACFLY